MDLIYVQIRLKGWSSPELASEKGKKQAWLFAIFEVFGSDMHNRLWMVLVLIDR